MNSELVRWCTVQFMAVNLTNNNLLSSQLASIECVHLSYVATSEWQQ